MSEEIRLHLELQVEQNLARGMTPEAARQEARRAFGGAEQIKEKCRDERSRGWIWLEHLAQDLRYAAGSLRRNPIFSLTAVLTLMLGLGATTAIFTLVDTVVWQPLPYAEPHRLVETANWPFSRQTLQSWTEAQQVADRVEMYSARVMILSGEGEAAQLRLEAMSPGLPGLLGRAPALGRWFTAEEAEEGNQFVVLISHRFWQQRFGGDPEILGRRIMLDDQLHTVIGVMPRDFGFRRPNTVGWLPLVRPASVATPQRLEIVARLRPGVEFAAAQAAMKSTNQRLDESHPQPSKWGVALLSLDKTRVNPGPRRMMVLVMGAVAFVLLIACANVANLLLVRATARQREFAVRAALGAGSGRLIRQVLTESLMLVMLGAVGGLLVAQWAVQALWAAAPDDLTFLTVNQVTVGWRVMAFAIVLVGLAALVCGLLPALRASRFRANHALGSHSRHGMATRGQRRWQQGFVVTQTALAFVLLVGAGLLLRGFLRLNAVSPGFEVKNLAALRLSLPAKRYASPAQRQDFYDQLRERVAALPGVAETALAYGVPPSGGGIIIGVTLEIEGQPSQKLGATEILPFNTVGDNYFRVMRIPVVRGRSFDAQDVPGGPTAVIINDRMASRFWPGADPIGRRMRLSPRQPWMTVVGVAGDVRARGPSDEGGDLEYYQSMRQEGYSAYSTLVVRTVGDPRSLERAIRSEVSALDPRLPISSFATVEALMSQTLAVPRFSLWLMTGFAGVALVLAAIGLYGVMAYTATQRTQEIGVRIALGSTVAEIERLVTKSGLVLIGLGLTVGVLAALGLTQFLRTMLFEVSALDPLTFFGVGVVLGLVGVVACWLPARRAAKLDPVIALRTE